MGMVAAEGRAFDAKGAKGAKFRDGVVAEGAAAEGERSSATTLDNPPCPTVKLSVEDGALGGWELGGGGGRGESGR